MDPVTRLKYAEFVFITICVVLPSIICLPIIPIIKKINPIARYLLAVFITWLALNIFNNFYYLGARLAHADYRGSESYDGVGVNVVILFLGWIIPIVTGIPALLIAFFIVED